MQFFGMSFYLFLSNKHLAPFWKQVLPHTVFILLTVQSDYIVF